MTHAQPVQATPALRLTELTHKAPANTTPVCDGCQVEPVTHPGYCARCRPLTKSGQGLGRGAIGIILVMISSGAEPLALALLGMLIGVLLMSWGAARLDGVRTPDLLAALAEQLILLAARVKASSL
ncbi:hypothetical protein [Deinococcus radiotolerans]|uniref:Zn-finger protein n=1 Tax=Deinococcus radiotolerans TaxID=1309407 RepID=A0ABQ2FQH8_9DEIO|nr:hypothetical protein [Deinococcus radiotolerans]GGL16716.1 hypothetical protein GCM10010844_39520 [Deinococcus radiotolerans]